ncbi:tetratricopeptide repeat-containing glycosyltransferase family 2 protein [Butyrivibrio sp. YAB3001]|uniref:tetratricopeptide repeat-containing glycosyltransferase family 2 protein n=1 Tax=Butyrivibrio sp. YAB3001 TaxID=1520812 RepID=UPI0008F61E72|nr:glycosyltransferase [Butyrivibrio sp. YAB3001]SFB76634.1 Glycosyltransferase involved in cell wall bisynthesis [Butyrivibrio sp. YAB3001]
MVTISLCMIVKNEESCIGKCLDSLKGIVDEMIVVDTGSTDKTVEIAKEKGAKVYHFAWTGDFSEARNYSFSLAKGDYIYAADADEELDEENRERFLKLKEDIGELNVDIVQMFYSNQLAFRTVYNYDKELRPKLFRRVRNFVWVDPVHEQVSLEPVVCDSDIEIIHRPRENHAGRDLASFRKAINDGRKISRRLLGMYARELFMAGTDDDFLQAEDFFKKAALDNGRTIDEVKEACCVLAHVAVLKKDADQLLKFSLKDAITDMSSEMCYELGDFYFNKKDIDEAIVWYYNAAYESKSILDLKKNLELPRLALAKCYRELGNDEQADDYEREANDILNDLSSLS